MRVIGPTTKSFEKVAHGYQRAGVQHLCSNGSAALFYDPGLGKTGTTLAAFKLLLEHGVATRALVIAPVRVCQLVWEQEAGKWEEFKDLRFANMASKSAQTRLNQLQANADIWLINPESVPWLAQQFQFRELPFDTLIIDELTKFKNSRAKRSQLLLPLANRVARRWGLTGSPAPNGYEDLFGEMKILDGGAALGEYITQYRDRYFTKGKDGFSYQLRPGADVMIQERLRPYVHALRAEDYLSLPPLIPNEIAIELPKDVLEQYRALKKQMVLDLPDGSITAVNAAALSNKLTQFTGGAVYTADGAWSLVHEAKIEALIELIESLQGQQLLIAYHYGHELERIQVALKKHFHGAKWESAPDIPYIGGGVSEKRARQIEEQWNDGTIRVLLGHPASMGHGLNFQKSGAGHICWFTQTWDFELWDQFIKRVLRQGTTAERVVNHRLVAVDTIDKTIGDAVSMKRDEQDAFMEALKAEFIRDDPDSARVFATGEDMRKVTLPGQTAPQQAAAPQQQVNAAPTPQGGWGGAAGRVAAPTPQTEAQLSKVAGPNVQPVAQAAQQGGWGAKFTQPATEQRVANGHTQGPPLLVNEDNGRMSSDPATFDVLEQIQAQVLQPGELQPQFSIQTGGERVDTAQAEQAPFEGGQPAKPAPAPRAARASKKAATGSPYAAEVFAYVANRMATGMATFEQASNEAAALVAALED